MSTNVGRYLEKWEICPTFFPKISKFSRFQWTNEPTDRHTNKKFNFFSANLWDRSRGRCPQSLVKIFWKLSDFSNFLTEGGRERGCEWAPQSVELGYWPKASGRAKNSPEFCLKPLVVVFTFELCYEFG